MGVNEQTAHRSGRAFERRRGCRVKAIAFLALGVLAVAAFASTTPPPANRDVRIARLDAEHRALMNDLDALQARLLVAGERVRFWQEMRERHESVSAVACTSQEAHAVAMAEHLLIERRPTARVRARVASVRAGPMSTPARR